jgi:RNA polymerase sigma factor (sigma-70 family)
MTKQDLKNYNSIKAEIIELDRLSRQLDKHATDALRDLYSAKREKLTAELRRVEQAIETLDPTERRLIRLRYIDALSWLAVSRRLNYSKPQAQRIHKAALIKLRDL